MILEVSFQKKKDLTLDHHMNILYLTQYFPPDKGAAQMRAWEMVKNLIRLGHTITVVTEFPNHPLGIIPKKYKFRFIAREVYRGVEVIRTYVKASPKKDFINRMMFYLSFMVTSVVAAVKLKRSYDLVYATSSPLFLGLSGFVIGRVKGIKFVFEARDIWPDAAVAVGQLRNGILIRLAHLIEKFCYVKSDKLVVVTKGCYGNLLQKNVDPEKVDIVYNGANIETFRPVADRRGLRERYGWEAKFTVLYAGNFGLIHGMNSLTEAVRILAEEDRIRFVFIGEGPMKSEVLRSQRKYHLANLKVLGDVPGQKLVDYLNLADVCLVSAKSHDLSRLLLPVKMFDAWACGKPIILSVDGEAREHMEKAGAGIWVEPEDSKGIASAVKYLFDNPGSCEVYGSNGRKYVEKHFSRKVQAEKLEKILLEVCNESTR